VVSISSLLSCRLIRFDIFLALIHWPLPLLKKKNYSPKDSALRSMSITDTSSLLWLLLTSSCPALLPLYFVPPQLLTLGSPMVSLNPFRVIDIFYYRWLRPTVGLRNPMLTYPQRKPYNMFLFVQSHFCRQLLSDSLLLRTPLL